MKVTRYLLYPCLLMAASASAQNAMTSSPYSMFGLGEMASGLYGQNTSMAGVTVGMREATPYTDAVSSATPLAALRLAESAWQRGLNVDLPSLSALFWGNVGGSLGETCVPALLLGGIYLLWRGHIDWRIPAGYIGTVVVITAIYGWLREYPTWFAIYHLLSGGLIIGAFFMATDWVTSPITKKGRLIYALGLGILTALIRLRGGYVEGVCYSILIMNMVTPLIDRYITNVPFGGGARHE